MANPVNKHEIEYYIEKLEYQLLELTRGTHESPEELRRLLFKHIRDLKYPASRVTTHFFLSKSCAINLSDLHRLLTDYMRKQVVRDFAINTLTIREFPMPRLNISWSTEMVSSALSRKRKLLMEAAEPPIISASASSSSNPSPPLKKVKEEGSCTECKHSDEVTVPQPEVKGLFRHALDDKGEWILPRQKYIAIQELKLPLDTHEDLCTTLRRLYILNHLLTPADLQVEVSVIKPHLVLEVYNFAQIDLEQWQSVAQFISQQKVYSDILFQFEARGRPVLRLSLQHSNPIFAD